MVKTYNVRVTCRVDPMQDEKAIDQEINSSLKMFKDFYRGKKSEITKSSGIEREYIFDDLTMVNSRRLKSVAERNKKSIQLKGVLIQESDAAKQRNDVSDDEDSSDDEEKNTGDDSDSSSKESEKEEDSDSSKSSKSSSSSDSDSSDSSKSSESSKSSNSSNSSESGEEPEPLEDVNVNNLDESQDPYESPTGLPFGKRKIHYDTVYNPPDVSVQGNDPYLDNFVPNLHVLAPADFNMGVKTDPSVMALSMLASSKNSKDFEKAKKLLEELQTLISNNILKSKKQGEGILSIHEKNGLLTMEWLQSRSVSQQLEDMGINRKVHMGLSLNDSGNSNERTDGSKGSPKIKTEEGSNQNQNNKNNGSWFGRRRKVNIEDQRVPNPKVKMEPWFEDDENNKKND